MNRNTESIDQKILIIVTIFLVVLSSIGSLCFAETGFAPGAVLREYRWYGPWVNANKFQRVTDPKASHSGAKEFLPNPVNRITIDDLDLAVKVEVCIESLQCHTGTHNKRIRLNGNEWLHIPEAEEIPGDSPECYQTLAYPIVEIPLSCVNEGVNTFELTTDGQKCYDFGWGQFIIYGVTFRIFYDESKNHPIGAITVPASGTTIGENPVITVAASSSDGIKRVDFIGFYEDFNYKGDNIWRQWQFALNNGLLKHHLGTVYNEPYSITWNTEWVPDQDKPMKIMARIVDDKGMQYITPAVEDIHFTREDRSVKLYKPYNIPMNWTSRAGKLHTCKALVSEDPDYAVDARMILVSWSGAYAERIGINGEKVVTNTGLLYDRSYNEIPVPVDLIHSGVNTLFTYSSTNEHGIEVNWPGIVLKVVYEGSVGVDENRLKEIKPAEYTLFQNTPNPFNPITTIEYMLPRETHVNLTIFNMSGQQVAALKEGVEKEGRYTVTFDAADLPSGLYFYRLESGEFIATKKMLLVK